ncbi:alpha/beta hydrolase [Autumnicola musiva]|uniref:Alpha/beta hydrolase n=1 Tax=Autumnicola musiva TaxID=3075589 RepID=A0ABU3D2X5_9FLAO|nr:alpha/beta hydrolase [Zunongwangia sp. F117]MDT0675883.1 alpha/beta hydrolase [Zunongwangia sp. F117]
MNKSTALVILLVAICFLHTINTESQEREGNIVEYFGKEKINEVSEGEILHLFEEGLILSGLRGSFAVKAVESDPVIATFLGKPGKMIQKGDSFEDKNGTTLSWDTISVNKTNEFEGNFRSGYLFLNFESDQDQMAVLEASGHTTAIVNGMPHEGDHYDYGWSLIPVQLKKGNNPILLTGGRFNRIRARLLKTDAPVQFTERDMTLPDLIAEENTELWGALRVMNVSSNEFAGGSILASLHGNEIGYDLKPIAPDYVKKVPFKIPAIQGLEIDTKQDVFLELRDKKGKLLDTLTISLDVKSAYKHHKETFISDLDGSVQYYSVAPSLTKNTSNQALTLTVHGASVEAVNQAAAYQQKDSMHIVAATNRRPFGFAWEDWGRMDAMEVLGIAEKKYETDPQHTYLTGHSMGGHGTWYLGVTYPDRFAAIGPAAGYPDLIKYRRGFVERMRERPESDFERFGMTKQEFMDQADGKQPTQNLQDLSDIIQRAGNTSRSLKLKENYLHYGVYVLHGEKDNVVPTDIAREMRQVLGTFHDDFAYYEYPDGEHWFGSESVDWPPLFEFFNFRKIKKDPEIDELQFKTASPGVSEGSHYLEIWQQQTPLEISSFSMEKEADTVYVTTENIALFKVNFEKAGDSLLELKLDDTFFPVSEMKAEQFFRFKDGNWITAEKPSSSVKNPKRNGTFKDAFKNNMVFVYATKGTKEENQWYLNRARYDAEKFWYRGNGTIHLVKDTDFKESEYPDNNIILYGNSDNNAAWKKLLKNAPFKVSNNSFTFGTKKWSGNDLGAYMVYPRTNTEKATIGIITATGREGMHAAYANDYLLNATFFPDVMIFDAEMPAKGLESIKAAGFFGNSWQIEDGDFVWGEENN